MPATCFSRCMQARQPAPGSEKVLREAAPAAARRAAHAERCLRRLPSRLPRHVHFQAQVLHRRIFCLLNHWPCHVGALCECERGEGRGQSHSKAARVGALAHAPLKARRVWTGAHVASRPFAMHCSQALAPIVPLHRFCAGGAGAKAA